MKLASPLTAEKKNAAIQLSRGSFYSIVSLLLSTYLVILTLTSVTFS